MKKIFRSIVAAITATSLASCSLAVPKHQSVTVSSNVPSAKITANGVYKGKTPVTFQAKRNETLQLTATKAGYTPATYKIDRKLSGTAMADIVGGLFIGVPFVGLLAPGAWSLEQDTVQIPLAR